MNHKQMSGSFRIITIAEIPVKIHWTFGLLIFALLYLAYISGFNLQVVGWLALFIFSLFLCIVLHEYGHALTARRYGVKTRDIILSPIGGVARLEQLPDKPMQEFFIALAGPLVNVAICFAMVPYFMLYSFDGLWEVIESYRNQGGTSFSDFSVNFLPLLFLLNILLAGFNLLPAFPMDGGRVFRALLSLRFGRRKATRIASLLGQTLAVGFMIYGFFLGSMINIFVGLFVFITASQEYRMVKMESVLKENKVGDILRRQFTSLIPSDAMQLAFDGLKTGIERNYLVMDENREKVIGVLHEEFILEALKKKDHDALVETYVSEKFEASKPEQTLQEIFHKMSEQGYSILPVYEEEQLVGVIDVSMMNNFLMVQQKIK